MKKYIIGVAIIAIGVFVFLQMQKPAQKTESELKGLVTNTAFQTLTFLSATTTTATSTASTKGDGIVGTAKVTGADKITFVFSRTGKLGNAGSSSFGVDISADNVSWVAYKKLIDNVTNTNSQTLTRVAAASLSGTSTAFYSMDLEYEVINYVRCGVAETTDGEHTCEAYAQF